MNRLSAAGLLALGIAHATYAQDWVSTSQQSNRTTTPYFAQSSGPGAPTGLSRSARASSAGSASAAFTSLSVAPEPADASLFSRSYSAQRLLLADPNLSAAGRSDASLAPPTPYSYMGREYRMQIALGIAFVRFRSSAFDASAVGANTSFSYFFREWLAIDGSLTTAFAPPIYGNSHVKYVGYTGGPRVVLSRGHWEPWAHVLVGGAHVIPQTGFGGKNGFELQLGGGADYNLNPHFSIRIEADWVRTNVFSQTQNNGQGVFGVVYNF
jgi:hypothetical protein